MLWVSIRLTDTDGTAHQINHNPVISKVYSIHCTPYVCHMYLLHCTPYRSHMYAVCILYIVHHMYASVSRISLRIHNCDNFETLFKTLQVYSLARASQSKTAHLALIVRFPQFKSRARFFHTDHTLIMYAFGNPSSIHVCRFWKGVGATVWECIINVGAVRKSFPNLVYVKEFAFIKRNERVRIRSIPFRHMQK